MLYGVSHQEFTAPIKGIPEQIALLSESFKEEFDRKESRGYAELCMKILTGEPFPWAPRAPIFAFPRWQCIAGTYLGAVERVFAELSKQHAHYSFRNCANDQAFARLVQPRDHWENYVRKSQSGKQGNSKILLWPIDYIQMDSEASPRILFDKGAGPRLNAFEMAIILFTHPELLVRDRPIKIIVQEALNPRPFYFYYHQNALTFN